MAQQTTPKARRAGATQKPRRADARRSIERILDAAVEELAHNQEASMAAVARRAGVVRATLYVHFPTREALIAAVTERAIGESADAIRGADPGSGEPMEALRRVLSVTWRTLSRFHVLVTINVRERDAASLRALHEPVLGLLQPLLERGQKSGAFSRELSPHWMLTVVLELVHAASREVSAGHLDEDEAERALLASVTGALAAPR